MEEGSETTTIMDVETSSNISLHGESNSMDSEAYEEKEKPKSNKRANGKAEKQKQQTEFDAEMEKQRLTRLNFLLEKTSLYSDFLSQKLNLDPKQKPKENGEHIEDADASNKKRKRNDKTEIEDKPSKKGKQKTASERALISKVTDDEPVRPQSPLITGGQLRSYQLKGVEWLVSLYENGLNGILADEMGLGKTIQCISFLAHLVENGVKGPFLIVGPLSTLANWTNEFAKWTPSLPVLMYHASKDERAEMRSTKLKPTTFKTSNGTSLQMIPIIITSYEIVMNDRKFLQKYKWKYIIVDEGHRIKNLNCKLIKELKSYTSANRLLLTGTPLQNNLTELWSLLNFLLPDIFDDLSSFQSWFDFSALNEQGGSQLIIEKEQQSQIVTKLHNILRPFLLRRVKEDVEIDIPKKMEKIVHTHLTKIQQKYYKAILDKKLSEVLSEQALKLLKNKGTGLQNMFMQLRKACNHPYLFEWPVDEDDNEIIDEKIVETSGKMQILDRLLTRLQKEGHRVLIFSQMTRMLDILEDYCNLREFSFLRLDGSTAQAQRQESIEEFSKKNSDCFVFLLSTRAGGLGINLTAADTVVFYDNDWNPQADLQAQDRCHRIGQTRAVRVYRFATANSVESRILERANNKMKLDQLVIQKGNFTGAKSKSSITEISELEQLLTESPDLAGKGEVVTDEVLFEWKSDEEEDEKKEKTN